MSKVLDFELISPEGILFHDEITELIALTDSGEVGILYNHANLKAKLGKAPVRYTLANGTQSSTIIDGGILEVKDNHITILTNSALVC